MMASPIIKNAQIAAALAAAKAVKPTPVADAGALIFANNQQSFLRRMMYRKSYLGVLFQIGNRCFRLQESVLFLWLLLF